MGKDGRQSIDSAWKELADAGFIKTKKEFTKKGNLPVINYYVYEYPQKDVDFQHAGFQHAGSTQRESSVPKTSVRETDQLLSTDELSIKKQSIPDISSDISGPPVGDPPPGKSKKKKAPKNAPVNSEPKELTIFQRFTATYDDFFRKLNGVPPQYNGASGTATNSLVSYFRKIAKDRALKDAVNDPNERYIDDKALEGWEYVLNNWHRLDNFTQGKTRLLDINSNIQNIITILKNGHSKTKNGNGQPTGGGVSTSSLASAIKNHYSGVGQNKPGAGTENCQ